MDLCSYQGGVCDGKVAGEECNPNFEELGALEAKVYLQLGSLDQ